MYTTPFNLEFAIALIKVDSHQLPTEQGIVLPSENISYLSIYEDIYSTSISGKLIYIDRFGVFDEYKKNANSFNCLYVKWGEGITKEGFFQIFADERVQVDQANVNTKKVTLHFTDFYFARYQNMKIDLGWGESKTIQKEKSIFSDIFTRAGMTIDDLEPSNETFSNYNLGNQSVIDTLRHLLPRCSSSIHGLSGYLLYNTTKNTKDEHFKTTCVTINTLFDRAINNPAYMKVVGGETASWPEEDKYTYYYSSKGRSLGDVNKILETRETGQIRALQQFMQNPMVVGFTSTKGKHNIFEIQTSQSLYNQTPFGTINSDESKPQVWNTLGRVINSGDSDKGVLANLNFDAFVKSMALQESLTIICKGNCGRYAGGIIEIMQPGIDLDTPPGKIRYIVKSVSHIYNRNSTLPYVNRMTLLRTSNEM